MKDTVIASRLGFPAIRRLATPGTVDYPAKIRGIQGARDLLDVGAAMVEPSATASAMVEIDALMSDPNLSVKDKREVLRRMRSRNLTEQRKLRRESDELRVKEDHAREELRQVKETAACIFAFRDWLASGPLVLERCEVPLLWDFRRDVAAGKHVDVPLMASMVRKTTHASYGSIAHVVDEAQSFVVRHDWAKAFENAKDFDHAYFPLPAPVCAFEFQICAAAVSTRFIALAMHTSDADDADIVMAILHSAMRDGRSTWMETGILCRHQASSGWTVDAIDMTEGSEVYSPFLTMIGDQIKAACIALDAEVASTEIVRERHLANRQWQRKGTAPDYRIVVLSRRAGRPAALPSTDDPKHRKRLHFRRGHWRHFEKHKTWIKWMLVGDPELGFIEKHYSL